MKTKFLICAVLLLGTVSLVSSVYVQTDNTSFKVAERFAS